MGFSNVSDADVVSRCTNIQTSKPGNPHFPNPPVDLAALKTAIDTFSALIAQALDGSKKVIAEKNSDFRTRAPLLWQRHTRATDVIFPQLGSPPRAGRGLPGGLWRTNRLSSEDESEAEAKCVFIPNAANMSR